MFPATCINTVLISAPPLITASPFLPPTSNVKQSAPCAFSLCFSVQFFPSQKHTSPFESPLTTSPLFVTFTAHTNTSLPLSLFSVILATLLPLRISHTLILLSAIPATTVSLSLHASDKTLAFDGPARARFFTNVNPPFAVLMIFNVPSSVPTTIFCATASSSSLSASGMLATFRLGWAHMLQIAPPLQSRCWRGQPVDRSHSVITDE